MAKFYLLNTVYVATVKYFAGREVDDTVDPKADIETAGGVCWDSTDVVVAAAAVTANDLRAKGADESTINFVMMAAASKAGETVTSSDLASTANGKGASLIGIEDPGALYASTDLEAALLELQETRTSRLVRGVVFANVVSLASFVGVAGGTPQDGVTYVAGDRVLLANQTTAAQNGVYVVGTVATGTAPLTRVADMPTGMAIRNGMVVEVSEGTIFAGSSWKAMCTGAAVVGTDDPVFYPRVCKGILTLASGTKTLGATEGLFLFSVTRSAVSGGFNTAGGTVTSTTGWRCASAGRTAGKSGVGALTIIAILAAGTINAADNSTFDWLVTNW